MPLASSSERVWSTCRDATSGLPKVEDDGEESDVGDWSNDRRFSDLGLLDAEDISHDMEVQRREAGSSMMLRIFQ